MPSGEIHRAGDAFIIEVDGDVFALPPGNADAIEVVPSGPFDGYYPLLRQDSAWGFLNPLGGGLGGPTYVLDAETGAWFETGLVAYDPGPYAFADRSARDGLAAFVSFEDVLTFARPTWDEPLATPRDSGIPAVRGLTVVDAERVYLSTGGEVLLIRVPMELPAEGEPTHEVLWRRGVDFAEFRPDGVGIPWNGVILDETDGNVWAYPIDGADPYPFLPQTRSGSSYYGEEYVTVLGQRRDMEAETLSLFRNSLDGEFEVLDEGILDFQARPWSPELGRIVYSVRDGDEVSVRQHRLSD